MEFSLRYITLYEMVTGERFSPPPRNLRCASAFAQN